MKVEAVSSSCQTSLHLKPHYDSTVTSDRQANTFLLHGDQLRQPDLDKGNQLCPAMPKAYGLRS